MDIKEIIFDLIDDHTKGVDTYNHNGSTWLIFTDSKKWAIELTKEKTLWYNYYFFNNIFKYLSLDVVENQHYITKWVEDTVINGVKSTKGEYYKEIQKVEYTIENGVKYTIDIEDAIQNGVKKTRRNGDSMNTEAEDAIQNGVKDTAWLTQPPTSEIEDTIQNGVKETKSYVNNDFDMNDAIQNGVKSTFSTFVMPDGMVEDTIQNGVKRTLQKSAIGFGQVEDTIENGVKKTKRGYEGSRKQRTKDTIQNGVKHTSNRRLVVSKDIEDTIQNGVKKTYSDKIPHEYDWTDQFTEEIDDVIENGVKETNHVDVMKFFDNKVDNVLQNGVILTNASLQIDGSCVIEDVIKEGVKHTEYGDWLDGDERLDDIIDNGIKETKKGGFNQHFQMFGAIENGVKETKTPGDGDIVTTIKWMKEHNTDSVPDMINDIIDNGVKDTKDALSNRLPNPIKSVLENGIKETKPMDDWVNSERIIENTIKNGIKETKSEVATREWKASEVINNGIKETNPHFLQIINPMDFEPVIQEMKRLNEVNDTIQNGIKEVKELPDQSGELRGYGDYYRRQDDITKPHTLYVNDVINGGIKETVTGSDKRMLVENVLNNGVKLT